MDKDRAKMIKTGIYANGNLRYPLDDRHCLTGGGSWEAAETAVWGSQIKEFVGHKLDLLTDELSPYFTATMCVGFSWIFSFILGQRAMSRLRRIMSAYTDDRPYSLDLVSAVSVLSAWTWLQILDRE
jgi:hypothetical protein